MSQKHTWTALMVIAATEFTRRNLVTLEQKILEAWSKSHDPHPNHRMYTYVLARVQGMLGWCNTASAVVLSRYEGARPAFPSLFVGDQERNEEGWPDTHLLAGASLAKEILTVLEAEMLAQVIPEKDGRSGKQKELVPGTAPEVAYRQIKYLRGWVADAIERPAFKRLGVAACEFPKFEFAGVPTFVAKQRMALFVYDGEA